MKFQDLLAVLDFGESIRVFVSDSYLCDCTTRTALNILRQYFEYSVENVESGYTHEDECDKPSIYFRIYLNFSEERVKED